MKTGSTGTTVSMGPWLKSRKSLRAIIDSGLGESVALEGVGRELRGVCQLVYEGEFKAEMFLNVLESEGVTRLCVVPIQYRMFASADLDSYKLNLEEALSGGGEPLNREPIERFEGALSIVPRDGYGQMRRSRW